MSDKRTSKRSCKVDIDYRELHNTGCRVEKCIGSPISSTSESSSDDENTFITCMNTEEDNELSSLLEQLSVSTEAMDIEQGKLKLEVLVEDIQDFIDEHVLVGCTLTAEDIDSRISKLESYRTQYRNLDHKLKASLSTAIMTKNVQRGFEIGGFETGGFETWGL